MYRARLIRGGRPSQVARVGDAGDLPSGGLCCCAKAKLIVRALPPAAHGENCLGSPVAARPR